MIRYTVYQCHALWCGVTCVVYACTRFGSTKVKTVSTFPERLSSEVKVMSEAARCTEVARERAENRIKRASDIDVDLSTAVVSSLCSCIDRWDIFILYILYIAVSPDPKRHPMRRSHDTWTWFNCVPVPKVPPKPSCVLCVMCDVCAPTSAAGGREPYRRCSALVTTLIDRQGTQSLPCPHLDHPRKQRRPKPYVRG